MRFLSLVMFLAVLAVDRTPQSESTSTRDAANRVRRITFNDIDLTRFLKVKELSLEHIERLPNAVTGLDGELVTIEGFMFPTYHDTGLKQFFLVYKLRL